MAEIQESTEMTRANITEFAVSPRMWQVILSLQDESKPFRKAYEDSRMEGTDQNFFYLLDRASVLGIIEKVKRTKYQYLYRLTIWGKFCLKFLPEVMPRIYQNPNDITAYQTREI